MPNNNNPTMTEGRSSVIATESPIGDQSGGNAKVNFMTAEALNMHGTPPASAYRRFRALILESEKLTRNGTYYTKGFLESIITRARDIGRNVAGWRGHWDYRRATQKLIFMPETFFIDGNDLFGEGYLRVDEETESLINDLKNGFGLPLSITSRVTRWEDGTDEKVVKFTEGDLLSIDLVGIPSSEKCGIIEFIEEPKEGASGQTVTNASEQANKTTEGKSITMPDQNQQSAFVVTEDGTQAGPTTQAPQAAPAAPAAPKTEETQAGPTTQAAPAASQAGTGSGISAIFGEDVRSNQQQELEAFRRAKAENSYNGQRLNIEKEAGRAFTPETVTVLMRNYDQLASNLASGLGVETYELSQTQIENCVRTARQMTRQMISTQEEGVRVGTVSAHNNNLLDPKNNLANAIVESIMSNPSSQMRLRIPSGLTWETVLQNESSRALIVNTLRVEGDKIRKEMANYSNAVTTYEGLQAGNQNHFMYGLSDHGRHVMGAVEGVQSDYDGPTLTQWVQLPSCTAAIIAAMCLATNQLLRAMTRVSGNRFQYYTYEACHPESHAPTDYTITVNMQASGQEVVTIPVHSRVTARYASYVNLAGDEIELTAMTDYVTAYSDNGLSFMLLGNDHFEGQAAITITLRVGAETDPCDVPVLLKINREERTMERQWFHIAIPYCAEALSAVITDTGVNLKSKALSDAIYMVYKYFEDMIMLKLQDAAAECIILKQMADPNIDLGQLIPIFNATSVSWNGSETDGTLSQLITLARRIGRRCVSGAGTYMIMPDELIDVLSVWRHDNNLSVLAGTIQSGNDATARTMANMRIVPAGEMQEETVLDPVTGETVRVLVGAIYIIDQGAIIGDWGRLTVQNEGKIYQNVTYTCGDGSQSQMIVPTGTEIDGFKAWFYGTVLPPFVNVIQVVLPHIEGCNTREKMPSYSLV